MKCPCPSLHFLMWQLDLGGGGGSGSCTPCPPTHNAVCQELYHSLLKCYKGRSTTAIQKFFCEYDKLKMMVNWTILV